MLRTLRRRGFTLVEMMVGLTIAAILLVLAAPMYSVWLADSQIQSAAESIASGLRFAQYQAVARNTSTQLVLNPATGTGGWTVTQVSDGAVLRTDTFRAGADRVQFAVTPAGNTTVTYTALGLIALANADATAPFTRVDVSLPAVAGSRDLRVVLVDAGVVGGRVKICDWRFPVDDPKGCPP